MDTPVMQAGVDEAGRGPLAGPVVAAAVILDPDAPVDGLDDSKRLGAARREKLLLDIEARALCYCVALASVEEIDTHNILRATLLAMRRAVRGLALAPGVLLVDGTHAPGWQSDASLPGSILRAGGTAPTSARSETDMHDRHLLCETRCIIGGDASQPAIGAASILAKVHRDHLMRRLDDRHPGYGFAGHKGYGTRAHLEALAQLGPCPVHRTSFAPVRRAASRQRAQRSGQD